MPSLSRKRRTRFYLNSSRLNVAALVEERDSRSGFLKLKLKLKVKVKIKIKIKIKI
jgi:hypothetical protein